MAEINLGKVKGEDGKGGGLTFGEKIMVFERSGFSKQGIWYRKLAESLVEIGIDYFESAFTMSTNSSKTLFTIPVEYRPKSSKFSGAVTYGSGIFLSIDISNTGIVTLRNSSSIVQNISQFANYGISFMFTID